MSRRNSFFNVAINVFIMLQKMAFYAAINGSVMSQQMVLHYRNKWMFNVAKRTFFNIATNGFLVSQK